MDTPKWNDAWYAEWAKIEPRVKINMRQIIKGEREARAEDLQDLVTALRWESKRADYQLAWQRYYHSIIDPSRKQAQDALQRESFALTAARES